MTWSSALLSHGSFSSSTFLKLNSLSFPSFSPKVFIPPNPSMTFKNQDSVLPAHMKYYDHY